MAPALTGLLILTCVLPVTVGSPDPGGCNDQTEPTFRVPVVRIDHGCMELVGLEPTTSCMPCRRSPS